MRDEITALGLATGLNQAGLPNILHTCRLQAFGGEVFGHSAVLETLRQLPNDKIDVLQIVSNEANVAVFTATRDNDIVAYICDRYAGGIGRIWRIGPDHGVVLTSPTQTSVPFDPALTQLGTNWQLAATDHPGLEPQAAECLAQIVADQLVGDARVTTEKPPVRTTAFVLRAWSQQGVGAALLALHDLTAAPQRQSAFRFQAVMFRFRGALPLHSLIATDPQRTSPWIPRVVARRVDT
jgi:hypothetical protein